MVQIAIRMPKMSMTMTEGEVSEWFVQPGDTVSEGDVVCEVLTDKVDMEVESPASGTISSIEVENGSVDVGTPIGYIEGEDTGGIGDLLSGVPDSAAVPDPETQREPAQADSAPEPTADSTPEPVSTADATPEPTADPASGQRSQRAVGERGSGPAAAVPRARSLAADHDIDLAELDGTGPDGLIVMADVESLVAPLATPSGQESAPSGTSMPAPVPTRTSKRAAQVRARVAMKMTESAGVPQFTVWRDLVLDEADGRRIGVSWTTVLLRAYATALREVPELLCRWEGSAAVESGPPSIGLAIDTPHGLLAPVLQSPDREPPQDLDRRLRDIVATARTGRVDSAYLRVANAALSNLGGFGVDRFLALVTPPQASVLSVGAIKPRVVAVAGGLGVALTVTLGLTVDHRVADGAAGARLLAALEADLAH